jgi:hypothetical protein
MPDYSPFFSEQSPHPLRRVSVGMLHLSSGQVYCCDPFLSHEVDSLALRVRPGDYEVDLRMADFPDWGERVALARLLVSSQPVTTWQEAVFNALGERTSSFRVDAGLACFMDRNAAVLLTRAVSDFYRTRPDGNYYTDLLDAEFQRRAERPGTSGDWAMHNPVQGKPDNVAIFASGLGDGFYTAWWGLDKAGHPAMLIVDFGLLSTDEPASD